MTLSKPHLSKDDAPRLRMPVARVFLPLLPPARYKGAKGGRASAKSHFFAEKLIRRCVAITTRAVCIREMQNSIDQSVHQLICDKIKHFGLEHELKATDKYIEGRRNGSLITYKGMQNHTAEAVKSTEGADVAWVEEAQSLSKRSLTVLRPTLRKPFSELWFSWNPGSPLDAVDDFLCREKPAGAVVVHATYKDNPWLSEESRREMIHDRERDIDRYSHVWLGHYRKLSTARVFRNWRIGTREEFDLRGKTFYFGADFGFSQDPSVIVGCYIVGRTLYVFAEAYAVGCDIDHLPFLYAGCNDQKLIDQNRQGFESLSFERKREWRGIPQCYRWAITADSARPETISYMQRHGFETMRRAIKGANSVQEGIEFLKGYDIVVHPDCIHTADELTEYSFKIDPLTEQVLPVLEDKKNHVIDSLRYAVEDIRRPQAGVW